MKMVVSTLQPRVMLAEAAMMAPQLGIMVLPELLTIATQIDVSSAGTSLRLDWPQVAGATEVALESARVTLVPPYGQDAGLDLGHLRGAFSGPRCTLTIAGAPRQMRSLRLSGLRLNDSDATPLPDHAALSARGLRLAVAVKSGGVLAPVSLAVPHIAPSPSQPPYVLPPLLAGASYSGNTLILPDVLCEELRIMVVQGDAPEDFAPQSFTLDYISGRAAPSPLDITMLDADGAPLYTGTGPIVASTAIDAKNAVQRGLEAGIASGAAPSVELRLTSRTTGKLGTYGIVATGEVRRVFSDKIRVDLTGDPVVPTFPGVPLDPRQPDSATADLVIEHKGLRLHDLSDSRPAGTGGHGGIVVGMEGPAWRALPPEGLRGETLRRVGLVGYGLEAARLNLRVLGATPDGSKVAPPDLATATTDIPSPDLTAAQPPEIIWFDLGDGLTVDQPIGVEVTAQSGRFLWIAGEGGQPLLRYAVAHPLTGGETLQIGGQTLHITDARTMHNVCTLHAREFAAPPTVQSAHFLTLTLSRLTLGYAP